MKLYRPVGLRELEAIAATNYRIFPHGLPPQPYVDLMFDREQAETIVREWNTSDAVSGFVGFVTELDVSYSLVSRYQTHAVGRTNHRELRVPSRELDAFNAGIRGPIRVVSHFVGLRFSGTIIERTHLPAHLSVPEVELTLPEPFASLIRSCETICVAGCCGVRAYDRTPENIAPWIRENGVDAAQGAAAQAARLAKQFEHSWYLVLSSENDFNFRWEGEYASTYFFEWRFNIGRAIRRVENLELRG